MKFKNYMLSCKQASQLASQALDRPIPARERLALGFHLLICRFCRRFTRQLAQIRAAIDVLTRQLELDESVRLSAEAGSRIAAALESGSEHRTYNDGNHRP
jgi:hypothetical protein